MTFLRQKTLPGDALRPAVRRRPAARDEIAEVRR